MIGTDLICCDFKKSKWDQELPKPYLILHDSAWWHGKPAVFIIMENRHCKSNSKALSKFIIDNTFKGDQNMPRRKTRALHLLQFSQGMVWKVRFWRRKENWMSFVTADKYKMFIVLTLFCNICIAALSYADKLIDATGCCCDYFLFCCTSPQWLIGSSATLGWTTTMQMFKQLHVLL